MAWLVNGLGATPLMELYLFNHQVAQELSKRGVTVARAFVGQSSSQKGTSLRMADSHMASTMYIMFCRVRLPETFA